MPFPVPQVGLAGGRPIAVQEGRKRRPFLGLGELGRLAHVDLVGERLPRRTLLLELPAQVFFLGAGLILRQSRALPEDQAGPGGQQQADSDRIVQRVCRPRHGPGSPAVGQAVRSVRSGFSGSPRRVQEPPRGTDGQEIGRIAVADLLP